MVWNKKKKAQAQKKRLRELRHNSRKRNVRQRYSSIASAIEATAPEATPLFSPHTALPPAGIQRDDNSPIVVNGVKIPSLCGDIKRKDTLEEALQFLTRTKIEEDSTTAPRANDSLNLSPEKHRACICVICDCFIIGTEEIIWLSKDAIKNKTSYLSTSYYESNAGRGHAFPAHLRNQYLIEDDDDLKDLLLSPRAHRRGNTFMSCKCCSTNIKRKSSDKPPRFGITNGWVIGYIPRSVLNGDIDDLLAAMISHVRYFRYVFSYIAGAHKSIKGHHTFFLNDPAFIGATFNFLRDTGAQKDVYVMLCGRMTPSQRAIAKSKCQINTEDYIKLLTWLISNHPSYKNMTPPANAPHPIPVGTLDATTNNTDQSDPNAKNVENSFDGSRFTFAPANQPNQNTGSCLNEKDFIFSLLKGNQPTLIFRGGDIVGGHQIKLEDMFPIQFPFGLGGLHQ